MTTKHQPCETERNEILNVLHGVAYILDTRSYDRLGQVFSADVHFENPGRLTADGLDNLIKSFKAISNPSISHHITNVILIVDNDQAVCATSKALTIRSDRSIAAAEYHDVLKQTDAGWRIASRTIRPLP